MQNALKAKMQELNKLLDAAERIVLECATIIDAQQNNHSTRGQVNRSTDSRALH